MSGVSREAWLSALRDAIAPVVDERDALSTKEFAALFEIAVPTAARKLLALQAAGRVRATTKRTLLCDGRYKPIPAWVLLDGPKKKR